jgi:hypothetical protein
MVIGQSTAIARHFARKAKMEVCEQLCNKYVTTVWQQCNNNVRRLQQCTNNLTKNVAAIVICVGIGFGISVICIIIIRLLTLIIIAY